MSNIVQLFKCTSQMDTSFQATTIDFNASSRVQVLLGGVQLSQSVDATSQTSNTTSLSQGTTCQIQNTT
jgi:hypothetical protein